MWIDHKTCTQLIKWNTNAIGWKIVFIIKRRIYACVSNLLKLMRDWSVTLNGEEVKTWRKKILFENCGVFLRFNCTGLQAVFVEMRTKRDEGLNQKSNKMLNMANKSNRNLLPYASYIFQAPFQRVVQSRSNNQLWHISILMRNIIQYNAKQRDRIFVITTTALSYNHLFYDI